MGVMIVTKDEWHRKKVEFNRPSFKKMLLEKHGNKCVNCGSDNDIEFHHIVALSQGGSNNIGNIVPLCFNCHLLAHESQRMKHIGHDRGGRPKNKPVDGYEKIIDKYLSCEIGTAEFKDLMNMSAGCKVRDQWWFIDYIKSKNIKQYRNNVDIISKNGMVRKNRIAGYVVLNDGRKIEYSTEQYIKTH